MPFRFVHTADIHLDSPLRSLAMRNPELAGLIAGATRDALTAIVDLCLEERVDALIVAGDLYDGDQTSMKTARFLAGQMERLHHGGIAAYKVRGNHDALSKITQELILPPSLKLFGGRAEAVEIDAGGISVAIHGLSFSRPHAPESLLPKYSRPRPGAVNIGIMHTSLQGAPGHDPYAPCAVADLQGWGFDYWALGHIHLRSALAGAATVVMPGMPQGRNIGEAGPKSVTLVTIGDDHSIRIEERVTSIAQFETVTTDLSGAASWPEAVDRVERAVAEVRASAAAPHLVARLRLEGATSLAWRLRHEHELLVTEIEHRMAGAGGIWIDKVEIAAQPSRTEASAGEVDPMVELGALIGGEMRAEPAIRQAVEALVKELRDDLPPDAREVFGRDEAAFEAFLDKLIGDSGEEIVARLAESGAEPR
ncbi:DNA repair exonuclease [Bosea sp. (in: a-proteobacteria)]|uniref:metallophosphoesterase family protein n=1 Tax=Bosea sp. (in: a-proteobacteria) TaxID=1871050 RepID=UPI001AC60961|nr:DNA repair exonuclease [Bosea sp. (in: a-proteobacteria)]MBN9438477.1 DNA repair exonuclease [Bosea sp. (in: a-proteobacteria)]